MKLLPAVSEDLKKDDNVLRGIGLDNIVMFQGSSWEKRARCSLVIVLFPISLGKTL